jgi:hypothetical protein
VDLVIHHRSEKTDRLMTVTIRPYARSPCGNKLLYTPEYSRTLTIASGVQGMIDLTIPGGAWSPHAGTEAAEAAGGPTEESKYCGSMNRMLYASYISLGDCLGEGNLRYALVIQVIMESKVETLYIFEW